MNEPAQIVRTPEDIADALGVELTPAFLKDIAEFSKWRDFPKKEDEGWDKDEILAFVERNKTKIASRKATAQLLKGDAKTTAADLKLIQAVTADRAKPLNLGDADTLTELSKKLDIHYRGRVRVLISKQLLNNWRKGQIPVKGAPLPPGKIGDSSRFSVGEWVAWFDEWLLPFYGVGSKTDLDQDYLKLEREEKANALERIEHERFERAVERGKWIERESAKRTLLGALKQFHRIVKDADERGSPIARLNKLKELGATPEMASAFHEFDLTLAREITDDRERQCVALGRGNQ